MDANGNNTLQESRVSGWKSNNNHSRNSRRKRKTLGKVHAQRVTGTAESIAVTTEKRRKDRVHLSLEELRSLLPQSQKVDVGEDELKDSAATQEELLAMAVEYLSARRANNIGSLSSLSSSSSMDTKYADHYATATPHSKRSRRRQQLHQQNDQTTETAATPSHNVAFHPPSPTNAMLEGFRDCMEETIRYLVEVERLPPDHDIVVRLRAHLLKAQSKLDLNNRISEGSLMDPSCTARVTQTHGSLNSLGSSMSTQTSPEAVSSYASSPAQIPVWVPSGQNGQPSSRTSVPVPRTSGLPNSSTARKVMKPLTVDTNQYYAMPSPLSRALKESTGNSNESLLTIARTLPTTTQPTYSTANVTGRALSYRRPTNTAPHTLQGAYLHRTHNSAGPTMVYSTTTLTAPIAATTLPATVTSATGHHLGFNLNYVAPYIMAWDSAATQEELLAMAVEYLSARRTNNIGSLSSLNSSSSMDTKYADHYATVTPHSKRSRRRQQLHQQNDQTTETAATPSHNVAFHPPSPTNAMLEGFRDCMEETIRYLVEVERLPPDHDIVVRLRAHLLKAQSKLDLNNRISEGSLMDPSCTARVTQTHGSLNSLGSSMSTQTSPEAVSSYTSSPEQIPVWVPSGQNGQPSSRTSVPVPRTSGLPNSSTARKVMKPLTVDTNQYYAMPSPLSRALKESTGNSNESLLTIARTLPTTTQPTYSTANVTGRALSYRRPTVTAPHTLQGAYLHRTHNSAGPTMVYSTTTLTAPIAATTLPATVTSATGHHLGFNLNYVAPYIMAWVRPAQQ